MAKRIYPQETAPAEELSYLPYGLQQPAGCGIEALPLLHALFEPSRNRLPAPVRLPAPPGLDRQRADQLREMPRLGGGPARSKDMKKSASKPTLSP